MNIHNNNIGGVPSPGNPFQPQGQVPKGISVLNTSNLDFGSSEAKLDDLFKRTDFDFSINGQGTNLDSDKHSFEIMAFKELKNEELPPSPSQKSGVATKTTSKTANPKKGSQKQAVSSGKRSKVNQAVGASNKKAAAIPSVGERLRDPAYLSELNEVNQNGDIDYDGLSINSSSSKSDVDSFLEAVDNGDKMIYDKNDKTLFVRDESQKQKMEEKRKNDPEFAKLVKNIVVMTDDDVDTLRDALYEMIGYNSSIAIEKGEKKEEEAPLQPSIQSPYKQEIVKDLPLAFASSKNIESKLQETLKKMGENSVVNSILKRREDEKEARRIDKENRKIEEDQTIYQLNQEHNEATNQKIEQNKSAAETEEEKEQAAEIQENQERTQGKTPDAKDGKPIADDAYPADQKNKTEQFLDDIGKLKDKFDLEEDSV